MKRQNVFVLAAALLFLAASGAQGEEPQPLQFGVSEARPLAELPGNVKAAEGELTLFADFSDIRGESIVLYLVNRTGEEKYLDSQDGDLYVKLETKEMEDVWYRAQGHNYSWCGNSYYPVTLPAGEFFVFLGYYPSEGEERVVRYRSFNLEGLVSNRGTGRVKREDLEEARRDRMAIETGDFEFVSAIALGERKLPELAGHWKDQREIAIYSLPRFGRRAEPVLAALKSDADQKIVRAAHSALARLSAEAEETE